MEAGYRELAIRKTQSRCGSTGAILADNHQGKREEMQIEALKAGHRSKGKCMAKRISFRQTIVDTRQ